MCLDELAVPLEAVTGGSLKGIVVDARYGLADVSNFFDAIQTPDSVQIASSIPVTGVTVSPTTGSITVGGAALELTATVAPEDATNKSVTWSSSDDTVATVSATGEVTAVGAGSATITVTTVDGSFTASCTVTVSAATVAVTGVTVSPKTDSLAVGDADITLTATVAPENATNQNVTWSSSSDLIATVSDAGVVHAVGAGEATITVTTEDGSFTDTSIITITT